MPLKRPGNKSTPPDNVLLFAPIVPSTMILPPTRSLFSEEVDPTSNVSMLSASSTGKLKFGEKSFLSKMKFLLGSVLITLPN